MRRIGTDRQKNRDLLATHLPARADAQWADLLIDPASQLAELEDLVQRGLVSPDEFERQRRKIFRS